MWPEPFVCLSLSNVDIQFNHSECRTKTIGNSGKKIINVIDGFDD